MPRWEMALLPWDLLCSPGRIAWEGDNTQHTTDRHRDYFFWGIDCRGDLLISNLQNSKCGYLNNTIPTTFYKKKKMIERNRARASLAAVPCLWPVSLQSIEPSTVEKWSNSSTDPVWIIQPKCTAVMGENKGYLFQLPVSTNQECPLCEVYQIG